MVTIACVVHACMCVCTVYKHFVRNSFLWCLFSMCTCVHLISFFSSSLWSWSDRGKYMCVIGHWLTHSLSLPWVVQEFVLPTEYLAHSPVWLSVDRSLNGIMWPCWVSLNELMSYLHSFYWKICLLACLIWCMHMGTHTHSLSPPPLSLCVFWFIKRWLHIFYSSC